MRTSSFRAGARVATLNLQPDLILHLTSTRGPRPSASAPLLDRSEARGAAFHGMARRGYLDQDRSDPGRYAALDASKTADEVWEDLIVMLSSARSSWGRGGRHGLEAAATDRHL